MIDVEPLIESELQHLAPRTHAQPNWRNVVSRSEAIKDAESFSASGGRAGPSQPPRAPRSWIRHPLALAAAVAVVAAGGAATAFAVRAFTTTPVTHGFSALDDPSLPPAPTTPDPSVPVGAGSVMGLFRELGSGDYEAKEVGTGMYLARRGNDLCEVVIGGAGQCTDHLNGDVWLFGDEKRAYDAETAPFEVHVYGFARDEVASVQVTTANGDTVTVPVEHNAFQTTLDHTSFADITAIETTSTSGATTSIDPRLYYPATTPIVIPQPTTTG